MKASTRFFVCRKRGCGAAGFTLIELLIVVAIIAILAAIAVPNFLEAQIRAKVSRALSDMRTIATGLETYAVDHMYYPPARINGQNLDLVLSERINRLTTPIAYLVSLPADIFPPMRGWNGKKDLVNLQLRSFDTYDYFDARSDWDEDMRSKAEGGEGTDSTRGCQWRLASSGPDLWGAFGIVWGPRLSEQDTPVGKAQEGVDYDSTNGTVSNGDVVRSGPRVREWNLELALQGG